MEPEGSLPHSQEPTICPCSDPYISSPCPSYFLKLHFNIIPPIKKKRQNFGTLSNPIRPPTIIFSVTLTKTLLFHKSTRLSPKCLILAHFVITEYTFLCKFVLYLMMLHNLPQLLSLCYSFEVFINGRQDPT